jgi:NAD(P)H dehydrogenase (quinone)
VTVSDLYRANFDPVERADHYAERISVDSFATLGEQRHAWNTCTLPKDVSSEIDKLQRADLVIL